MPRNTSSIRTKRFADIKPGDRFLTVQQLSNGWAAVEMWLNNDAPDVAALQERAGFGRYARREQAQAECLRWSESDEIPVLEGTIQAPVAR